MRVTGSGWQGIKTGDHFCRTLALGEFSSNRESDPKDHLLSAGSPLPPPSRSAGATFCGKSRKMQTF